MSGSEISTLHFGDSVSDKYLKSVLVHFNFGQLFRNWVDLVMVNGKTTAPFNISSVVRQGCVLSPILFVLALEPLACTIRQNNNIRGQPLPGSDGQEGKLSLYMDDLTLLLTNNRYVRETLTLCEHFAFGVFQLEGKTSKGR